jgi:hypothetical protein
LNLGLSDLNDADHISKVLNRLDRYIKKTLFYTYRLSAKINFAAEYASS